MTNEELEKQIDELILEVNRPIKVDSPLFTQKSYDFSELVSKCGKLWARAEANFKSAVLEFDIWESLEELNVRATLEHVSAAKDLLDDSPGKKSREPRVTEGKIKAEVKSSKEYAIKKQNVIKAEELKNVAENALFEASKMRGFISQAIIKKG